jgi:glycosyltransferase involved in cell wall biosynthesis
MSAKLTALIPTFNEQEMIRDCLESVRWADEILVVDSFSRDKTLDIANEYGARILQHEYQNSAAQKNWAIPQATHEWVLLVDSDERGDPRAGKRDS